MIDASVLLAATKSVTKEWTKQRKAEERGRRSASSREYVYSDRVNFTAVAARVLPAAYKHASGDGKYSVSKRQLYYASRQAFLEHTGRELEYAYFAGTLLVQYMNRTAATASWKVTADPRGTLLIPNAGREVRIPCGTIDIDNHLAAAEAQVDPLGDIDTEIEIRWPSLKAGQRYQAVVYIEKEGFGPLLEEAQIGKRFDVAILSCKGQSVVAARRFVDEVCGAIGVPLLVIHDFDKSGFEISQRLTSVSEWAAINDRVTYEFQNDINVTDLGLRLADIEEYKLDAEDCEFTGGFAPDSIATAEERAFLKSGRRVELNAFTSPQFIAWLEAKLTAQGLGKRLIPDDATLADAYRRAIAVAHVNRAIADAREEAEEKAGEATIPKNLRKRLEKAMKGGRASWDKAIYDLVAAGMEEDQ